MQFSQNCHLFFKLLRACVYWLLFFRIGLGTVHIFWSAFYPPSAFSHPRFILHPHFLIRVLSSIRIFSSAFYPQSAFSHPYFLIRIRIRHSYPHPYPRFIPTLCHAYFKRCEVTLQTTYEPMVRLFYKIESVAILTHSNYNSNFQL